MSTDSPYVMSDDFNRADGAVGEEWTGAAGEWGVEATSPQLHTSRITSLVLCEYTGEMKWDNGKCAFRTARLHPNEDCLVLYHSSKALAEGTVHVDMTALATRVPVGGEPTYEVPDDERTAKDLGSR